jgi:transcriptional antiterminator NusG
MTPWYVIQVRPGAEKKVAEGLEEHKLEVSVPMERFWIRNAYRKLKRERPVIRGYVFAILSDATLALLHDIDGAQRAIGIIPPAFIIEMQDAEKSGAFDRTRPRARREYRKGQKVRVTEGPYAGYIGEIAKLKGDKRAQIILAMSKGAAWPINELLDRVEPVEDAKGNSPPAVSQRQAA